METERFELSSGMGYKPASTSVGLLISIKLWHDPFLLFYQSIFNCYAVWKKNLTSLLPSWSCNLHVNTMPNGKLVWHNGRTASYAARAWALEKSALITLLAFNLICLLITQNSTETRSLNTPIHPSNPKRPHIQFSMCLIIIPLI